MRSSMVFSIRYLWTKVSFTCPIRTILLTACASWKAPRIGSTRKTWLATMRSSPSAPRDSGSSSTRTSELALKVSMPPTEPKSLARAEHSTCVMPFACSARPTISNISVHCEKTMALSSARLGSASSPAKSPTRESTLVPQDPFTDLRLDRELDMFAGFLGESAEFAGRTRDRSEGSDLFLQSGQRMCSCTQRNTQLRWNWCAQGSSTTSEPN
mmetsp:Transcript_146/g.245  ORF Transcript_146/g.245 Transcript_146/m.245 type:complete len:213 (+) Transcript_146:513-1151(+)